MPKPAALSQNGERGGYMKIKPVNWLIPGREQDQTGVAFALANSKETPAYP
jgi:hypothetical protein